MDSQSHESLRDTPPIITYPEFLVSPSQIPPFITARRALNTLCVTGGLITSIYGISQYIVSPMAEKLTEARESLAATALVNLEKLNLKLEQTVSEIPDTQRRFPLSRSNDVNLIHSGASSDSDPTELFHVDVGTQTSPRTSRSSSLNDSTLTATAKADYISDQESRLKGMRSRLSEIVGASKDMGDADTAITTSIQDLNSYLETLLASNSYHGKNQLYGALLRSAPETLGGAQVGKNVDDAAAKVKAEIRGIKGVLLSARNFPPSGGRVRGRVGAH